MATLLSNKGPELLIPANRKSDFVRNRRLTLPDDDLTPGSLAIDEKKAEAHPEGAEIKSEEISEILNGTLDGKLHKTFSLRLGDSSYYLPSKAEVNQILSSTTRERRSWIAERFDCDDFAYVLKAYTSSIAYINDELKLGLCCGIIWGKFAWLSEFHACNWFITSDNGFILIEPQNDQVYPPSDCEGSVTFAAA